MVDISDSAAAMLRSKRAEAGEGLAVRLMTLGFG